MKRRDDLILAGLIALIFCGFEATVAALAYMSGKDAGHFPVFAGLFLVNRVVLFLVLLIMASWKRAALSVGATLLLAAGLWIANPSWDNWYLRGFHTKIPSPEVVEKLRR
jgi:hypothetical protein